MLSISKLHYLLNSSHISHQIVVYIKKICGYNSFVLTILIKRGAQAIRLPDQTHEYRSETETILF